MSEEIFLKSSVINTPPCAPTYVYPDSFGTLTHMSRSGVVVNRIETMVLLRNPTHRPLGETHNEFVVIVLNQVNTVYAECECVCV